MMEAKSKQVLAFQVNYFMQTWKFETLEVQKKNNNGDLSIYK